MHNAPAQPRDPASAESGRRRVVMLGLAGGIGSGKSTVARCFAALGWLVIDSDAEAKAALREPAIVKTLTEWWGPGILRADGSVDRQRVGEIVFSSESERCRLEWLIHPRIAHSRDRAIEAAEATASRRAVGVVYDAPLLFEAGLDRECDAVAFVEAPREARVERVRGTRGWSDAELDRRESAQWPLERKKQACRFIIHNSGTEWALRERCREISAILLGERGSDPAGAP